MDIGFTPKRLGCNALRNGTPNLGHNEECRQRVMEHLESTAAGRGRLEKDKHRTIIVMSRFIQQQQEHQQQQQEKREQHNKQEQQQCNRQGRQQEQQEQHDTSLSSSSSIGLQGSLKRTAEAEGGCEGHNYDMNNKNNKRGRFEANEGENMQAVPDVSNTHTISMPTLASL